MGSRRKPPGSRYVLTAMLALCGTIACADEAPSAVMQQQACAAPDRMPGDAAAKANRALYQGIGINAAICVAGAPDSREVSNGGQSVDALRYADGRTLRFRGNQLEAVVGPGSQPLRAPPAQAEEIDPERREACGKAKITRPAGQQVRIGDSEARVRCLMGAPSDTRDLETASVYVVTLFYVASDGTLEHTITLRNGRVSAIQHRY